MKCSLLVLSSHLDGELEARRSGELEAHLVGCERCGTALGHLEEEVARVGGLARAHVPDHSAHELFVQLGLVDAAQPLPPRSSDQDDHLPVVEILPWLNSETGKVLPWTSAREPRDRGQPGGHGESAGDPSPVGEPEAVSLRGEVRPVLPLAHDVHDDQLSFFSDDEADTTDTADADPGPSEGAAPRRPVAAPGVNRATASASAPGPVAVTDDAAGRVERVATLPRPQPPGGPGAAELPPFLRHHGAATAGDPASPRAQAVASAPPEPEVAARRWIPTAGPVSAPGATATRDPGLAHPAPPVAAPVSQPLRPGSTLPSRHQGEPVSSLDTPPRSTSVAGDERHDPHPYDITGAAPLEAASTGGGPIRARVTPLDRIRERVALRRALSRSAQREFDDSVQVFSGRGAPLGTARERLRSEHARRDAHDGAVDLVPPDGDITLMGTPVRTQQVTTHHAAGSGEAAAAGWGTPDDDVDSHALDHHRADRVAEWPSSRAEEDHPPGDAPLSHGTAPRSHGAERVARPEATAPRDGSTSLRRRAPRVAASAGGAVSRRVQELGVGSRAQSLREAGSGVADRVRTAVSGAASRVHLAPAQRPLAAFAAGVVILLGLGLAVGRSATPTASTGTTALRPIVVPSLHAGPLPTASALAPAAPVAPSPAPAVAGGRAGAQQVGEGGSGWHVAGVRYGIHPGSMRVVFDLGGATASGSPRATVTSVDSTTLRVVLHGVTGAVPLGQLPVNNVVRIVTSAATPDGATYDLHLVRPVTPTVGYAASPLRLVLDLH